MKNFWKVLTSNISKKAFISIGNFVSYPKCKLTHFWIYVFALDWRYKGLVIYSKVSFITFHLHSENIPPPLLWVVVDLYIVIININLYQANSASEIGSWSMFNQIWQSIYIKLHVCPSVCVSVTFVVRPTWYLLIRFVCPPFTEYAFRFWMSQPYTY